VKGRLFRAGLKGKARRREEKEYGKRGDEPLSSPDNPRKRVKYR
jgi:hypothetical protein